MEEINVFDPLVVDEDYEMLNEEPYTIRRISNGFIPKINTSPRGYNRISLYGNYHQYHRILAIQFIPNLNNRPEMDHKNHIRTDNRLENLRWVSISDNTKNLSGQRLDLYNGHDLEGYSFDQDFNVYCHNGLKFRKLHVITQQQYEYVWVQDINNKRVKICLIKLQGGNYE